MNLRPGKTERIIKLRESGATVREIAAAEHVSQTTVCVVLKSCGITDEGRFCCTEMRNPTPAEIAEIAKRIREEGYCTPSGQFVPPWTEQDYQNRVRADEKRIDVAPLYEVKVNTRDNPYARTI